MPSIFTHDNFQLGGGRADVVATRNTINASVGQWTGALTYGLTDRLDLSLAVPVINTRLNVISAATILRVGTGEAHEIHFFRDPDATNGIGDERTFQAGGSATGVGDLIVRVKGSVLRRSAHGLAVGLDLRMPTGDERNLLGSGAFGAKPFVAYSANFNRISPHVNIGYQWNGSSILAGDPAEDTKDDLPDQLLYAAGADVGVTEKFSLTADLLGRWAIDSPRVTRRQFTASGPASEITIDDIAIEQRIVLGVERRRRFQGQSSRPPARRFQPALHHRQQRPERSRHAAHRVRVRLLAVALAVLLLAMIAAVPQHGGTAALRQHRSTAALRHLGTVAECLPLEPRAPHGNYLIPGTRGDIVYRIAESRGEPATRALDAYRQPGGTRLPAVIVVHGGNGAGSRVSFVGQLLETLTAAGYQWVSIDYTLDPGTSDDGRRRSCRPRSRSSSAMHASLASTPSGSRCSVKILARIS